MSRSITQPKIYQQIYKGLDRQISGDMTNKIEWWIGLGDELQIDIETIEE
tara:strand:- start:1236 stop:1385 length:150 start_codon:yes stop_codon:yes gene_type:complete